MTNARKILIVDDDTELRDALVEQLALHEEFEATAVDSGAKGGKFAGARGETHDWTVSREIVEKSRIPVILAGGLTAENVGEAIATVRPWGVDSFTHTDMAGNRGKKDPARQAALLSEAHRAIVEWIRAAT